LQVVSYLVTSIPDTRYHHKLRTSNNLKAGFDINPLAVSSKVGPVKRAFFNLGYAFYETPQVSVSAVLNTEYNIFPADGPKAIELMPGFSIFFGGGK